MKYMWFMEDSGCVAKTVVFSEEVMQEYLEAGYQVTGKYQIQFIEGIDYLPSFIGDD